MMIVLVQTRGETAIGGITCHAATTPSASRSGAAWIPGDSETKKLTLHSVARDLQYVASETL